MLSPEQFTAEVMARVREWEAVARARERRFRMLVCTAA